MLQKVCSIQQVMIWFLMQVQDMDQTCINSLAQADDMASLAGYDFAGDGLGPQLGPGSLRLLAYRYREMRARYLSGRACRKLVLSRDLILQEQPMAHSWPADAGLAELCNSQAWRDKLRSWEELLKRTDELAHGWLSHAAKLVTECSERTCSASTGDSNSHWDHAVRHRHTAHVNSLQSNRINTHAAVLTAGFVCQQVKSGRVHNVVVTTGQLVPTLAKLLLFQLSAAFPPESIYSARNQGKQHCFDLIRACFGAAARYCVIGAPLRLPYLGLWLS